MAQDEEGFEVSSQAEIVDFSNQAIDDLEPLIDVVFAKMPNLRELNLSNNLISNIPSQLWQFLPNLESINLNNNQIPQEEDQFAEVVNELSKIGSQNTNDEAGLKSLFINLTREQQVDFILRKLPRLEFLNGLAVDREELYSS